MKIQNLNIWSRCITFGYFLCLYRKSGKPQVMGQNLLPLSILSLFIYYSNKTIILDTIKLFLSPKEECFKKFSNVLAKHYSCKHSMCILAQGNFGICSDHYQRADCFHNNGIISSSVSVFHFPR